MPVKSKDTRAAVYLTAEGVLPPAYVYMVSQKNRAVMFDCSNLQNARTIRMIFGKRQRCFVLTASVDYILNKFIKTSGTTWAF